MKTRPARTDHTLILLLLALFVFHSPFTHWWTSFSPPWYTLFVAWGVIIALVAVNQHRNRKNRGD